MPLLYNSNYESIDTNRLNKVKKRINKSALVQFTKIGNIQSTIQPTKEQMKNYFLQITTFLNKIYQQLIIVLNSGNYPNRVFFQLAIKLTQEYTQQLIEFATNFNLTIYPYYNYFSAQQNELIKQDIIKLNEIFDLVLFENRGEQLDNFIETSREQLKILSEAISKYSPLKINVKPSDSSLFEKVEKMEGGYVGGSRMNFYPEIRFL
jgi:hypothetical protein